MLLLVSGTERHGIFENTRAPLRIDRLKAPNFFLPATRRSWHSALDPWLHIAVCQQLCLSIDGLQNICRIIKLVRRSGASMRTGQSRAFRHLTGHFIRLSICLHVAPTNVHPPQGNRFCDSWSRHVIFAGMPAPAPYAVLELLAGFVDRMGFVAFQADIEKYI